VSQPHCSALSSQSKSRLSWGSLAGGFCIYVRNAVLAFLLLLMVVVTAAVLSLGAVGLIHWWEDDVIAPYSDPEPNTTPAP
jgi:hypothetical protein